MAVKFNNIYQSVQNRKYDILDPRKQEFDVDFLNFMTKIENLEVSNIVTCNLLGEKFYRCLLNACETDYIVLPKSTEFVYLEGGFPYSSTFLEKLQNKSYSPAWRSVTWQQEL